MKNKASVEFLKHCRIRYDQEQAAAVTYGSGPLLVLAGPGSGKTTVLTGRISYLTRYCRIPEENILVLTFTRKAAEEMKSRYCKLEEKEFSKITFGTFHAVFYHFLCKYSNYSQYRVAEHSEILQEINILLKQEYGESFNPGLLSESICGCISRMKNGLPSGNPLADRFYPLLEARMKRNNRIDYDDMLLRFLQFLLDDPQKLLFFRDRFRYILIDEFQDINRTQYEIIRLLGGESGNVFAVGDDDQSIYGFRGSDPSYMKQFLRDFPGAKKILLSANYRSTAAIVKASSRLISKNSHRFRKRLHSKGVRGLKPVYQEFSDIKEEAQYVVKTVEAVLSSAADAGLPVPGFAILGRTRQYLKQISLLLPEETLKHTELLTFHASKGLEFDWVFIVGANEGVTPVLRNAEACAVEEERRCFYVAMTRARHSLHILNTSNLYDRPSKGSRFVKETKSFW